jgi:hypothetical protein
MIDALIRVLNPPLPRVRTGAFSELPQKLTLVAPPDIAIIDQKLRIRRSHLVRQSYVKIKRARRGKPGRFLLPRVIVASISDALFVAPSCVDFRIPFKIVPSPDYGLSRLRKRMIKRVR